MKRNWEPIYFVLLSLCCGQSLFAQQAKAEVANATKAAKRAWESAPKGTDPKTANPLKIFRGVWSENQTEQ